MFSGWCHRSTAGSSRSFNRRIPWMKNWRCGTRPILRASPKATISSGCMRRRSMARRPNSLPILAPCSSAISRAGSVTTSRRPAMRDCGCRRRPPPSPRSPRPIRAQWRRPPRSRLPCGTRRISPRMVRRCPRRCFARNSISRRFRCAPI